MLFEIVLVVVQLVEVVLVERAFAEVVLVEVAFVARRLGAAARGRVAYGRTAGEVPPLVRVLPGSHGCAPIARLSTGTHAAARRPAQDGPMPHTVVPGVPAVLWQAAGYLAFSLAFAVAAARELWAGTSPAHAYRQWTVALWTMPGFFLALALNPFRDGTPARFLAAAAGRRGGQRGAAHPHRARGRPGLSAAGRPRRTSGRQSSASSFRPSGQSPRADAELRCPCAPTST